MSESYLQYPFHFHTSKMQRRFKETDRWELIDTAPRNERGSLVLCWAKGWEPCLLIWKTNDRIVRARLNGEDCEDMQDSYFGDPVEDDDYALSRIGGGPTHWLPITAPDSI